MRKCISPLNGILFDFCNADYESISSFLLESDFSVLYDCFDIEYIWFFIKSLIYKAMLLYIPRIQVKQRHGPKWFDSDIHHHLKCLRTLKRKFKTHPFKERIKYIIWKVFFNPNLYRQNLTMKLN